MDRAAAGTRIRRDYLIAMEKDDFTFQAPAYVKGFVMSYARFLRLEAEPLVRQLDEALGGEPNEARVLADQNALWSGTVRMPSAFRPLVATTVALLLLTTAALWTRKGDDPRRPETSNPVEAEPAQVEPERVVKPVEKDRRAEASRTRDRVRVEIRASFAHSWLEVEVDGDTQFVGMLERGQTHTVKAKRKVRLLLGYPAGVELTVDGRRLGSPGGEEVIRLALPDDLPSLT